jgi:uncharacterized protein (DUF433 family)
MKEFASCISINPEIRFGKPCVKGTRIAIADILSMLASGASYSEILEDFPSLKDEHIIASLVFAANRDLMIKLILN